MQVLKLDEFLDLDRCDFLKIDVESMELEVLKGGMSFLKKFNPIIWIENHDKFPNKLNKFLLKTITIPTGSNHVYLIQIIF